MREKLKIFEERIKKKKKILNALRERSFLKFLFAEISGIA